MKIIILNLMALLTISTSALAYSKITKVVGEGRGRVRCYGPACGSLDERDARETAKSAAEDSARYICSGRGGSLSVYGRHSVSCDNESEVVTCDATYRVDCYL